MPNNFLYNLDYFYIVMKLFSVSFKVRVAFWRPVYLSIFKLVH